MIAALQDSVPLSGDWRTAVLIVGSFVLAWIVAKASGRVAVVITRWWERRHGEAGPSPDDTAALRGLKRRDTAVSLVQSTVRYVAYGLALTFSFVQISGFSQVTALAGASLIVVLIGFAGQRFLTDIIAGFLMFFEGWFSVGDTITVEPWALSGVVEEMSLRSTTLRAVTGETIAPPRESGMSPAHGIQPMWCWCNKAVPRVVVMSSERNPISPRLGHSNVTMVRPASQRLVELAERVARSTMSAWACAAWSALMSRASSWRRMMFEASNSIKLGAAMSR